MKAHWQEVVRRGLVVPLAITLVLAASLGFVVGARLDQDVNRDVARVVVLHDPAITPAPASTRLPRQNTGSSACPAGCECDITPGRQIVHCVGN